MKKLLLLLLFPTLLHAAHTEFYCYPASGDDSNLNSGSSTNAPITYAGGTFVRSTGVFTVASGNPVEDGVDLGEFASIYTTAGATLATFIGRVTATNGTTITVSTTAISGATSSVDEGAGAATCKVGGPWTGPNASVQFPFNFAANTMTNASGNVCRVNFQNAQAYTLNNSAGAINHTLAGPVVFQGFTATPGDLGKATINDTTTAASYVLATIAGATIHLVDFIFHSSFSSGTSAGVVLSGGRNNAMRVVVHDVRGVGINLSSTGVLTECEAYACNKRAATDAGISMASAGGFAIRCISHDNSASGSVGFLLGNATAVIACIADSNAGDGFVISATSSAVVRGCDSYANGGDGLDMTASGNPTMVSIENSNFVDNTGWGINSSASPTLRGGSILNCGFPNTGGSTSNGSGNINTAIEGVLVSGTVTYANTETPWSNPSTGDFRITLAAAKGAGIGSYARTDGASTSTVGYPDIGAAQHQETATSSGGSYTWAQ